MRKDEYKELIKKLKFLVENHSDKKGVDELVGLWEKMKNSDMIFILDKDVKKEIERLYNEHSDEHSETDVVILFDGELNQETLNWVRENFDDTAKLISDSLSIDIEKAKDILRKTIDESETVKVPVVSGKKFVVDDSEADKGSKYENSIEKTLLSRVFFLIENYNRVLAQLSIYSGNQSEKDDKLLSVLQENKPETGEIVLKIPFKNKGAGAHLSELLIEAFGKENGFELCSGCDFLTVIIREDVAPTVNYSDDEGSPTIEKDIDKFIILEMNGVELSDIFRNKGVEEILQNAISDSIINSKGKIPFPLKDTEDEVDDFIESLYDLSPNIRQSILLQVKENVQGWNIFRKVSEKLNL